MNKKTLIIMLVIIMAGCTNSTKPYTAEGAYSMSDIENIDVLVTDDMRVGTTSLFSGEMTRLILNVINIADVNFKNVRAIIINADDLNPTSENDYYAEIDANTSRTFDWDLTAPSLGLGETLYLNDIKVRVYYDTTANASKRLLLKVPGDRTYESTFASYSQSPVSIRFDTSYETVTTLQNGVKNFTINLLFFNNYSGIIDYYDNTDVADNYVKNILLGIDKQLIFYNYIEANTPWEKVNSSYSESELAELQLTLADLEVKDYYLLEYTTLGDGCLNLDNGLIETQSAFFTNQRKVLWMTRGSTKVNVLRFGANTVDVTTEVELTAKMDYGYSQDFGGENFGLVVYGLG